jgi:hypothetical protein
MSVQIRSTPKTQNRWRVDAESDSPGVTYDGHIKTVFLDVSSDGKRRYQVAIDADMLIDIANGYIEFQDKGKNHD